MEWKQAPTFLPNDQEEVIIKCSEGFQVAVFNKEEKAFILTRGGRKKAPEEVDLWTRLETKP